MASKIPIYGDFQESRPYGHTVFDIRDQNQTKSPATMNWFFLV